MDRDVLRPGWPCIQLQRLGLSDEILRVIYSWAVRDEFPKLLIGTSVLFWCYHYE